MNRLLVLANRGLYGVVILAGAALVVALGDRHSEEAQAVAPLQLPAIAMPTMTLHAQTALSDRNIFDPDGKPWVPAPPSSAESKAKAEPPASMARGLIQLPGLEGVLTDTGFVTTGQALPEGTLKQITNNGYVVAGAGGDQVVKFDAERQKGIYELFHPVIVPAEPDEKAAEPSAAAPANPSTRRPQQQRPQQQAGRPQIRPPSSGVQRPPIPGPPGAPIPGQPTVPGQHPVPGVPPGLNEQSP